MTALLIDLDGVLRQWDLAVISGAERRAGLPEGTIARAAFLDHDLLHRAVTGAIDDATWRSAIADAIDRTHGGGGRQAVKEWSIPAGRVDHEVLSIVREQRSRRRVGLLTNATTRLRRDLERLGLQDEFDAVINTADHGVAKPDPRIFAIAADQLGSPLANLLFVDDTRVNVEAAAALGASVHHFTNPSRLRNWLATWA
ncbi:HAD family hydrolase [Ornithinimicrobium pratense]|uniref:HAD family hydrolase n=1 Tax=Ornithinimicrobium pratense TaxID=2593973 RepID=UPI0017887DAD|nr:HAD-IA family hydrolase [Ornithinimicrobium pratense]